MYARAVDDAALRLRDLRHEERSDLGLAAFALVLAVAATEVRPELALPLFLGGIAVGAFGLRALWRRWDLVDRLAGERDAFVIPEVLAYAARAAGMERRRGLATAIRSTLSQPGPGLEKIGAAADELRELAAELEDSRLALDPASAVACMRLLGDLPGSPLLDPAVRVAELRWRVQHIRRGFRVRQAAA